MNKLYEINDTEINLILSNFEVLSKIQYNDKLTYTNNKLIIDNSYYFRPLYRWYNNYNRLDTLLILNNMISNIMYISDFFIQKLKYNKNDKSTISILNTILTTIQNSYIGFNNLDKTYCDNTFSIKINSYILKLENLEKLIIDLFK
tara:strand:- start:63 stop:500 length:438 start_codon:yes stop_codon:yes gene_type:complete